MGKLSYMYTDSEEEDTSSSVETTKKKKKFSILKYSTNNVKKKSKQSKSDPDSNINLQGVSSHRVRYKLPGILKNANYREKERESSDEDDEVDYSKVVVSRDRCLVGRVPRPPGTKPGRGGGLAILVRKNVSGMQQDSRGIQPQQSTSSTKRKRKTKLSRKKSY